MTGQFKVVLGKEVERRLIDLQLDLVELMSTRLLIQGASGAGKTWTLRRTLEQSARMVQQIVVDIEGDFASLSKHFGHAVVGVDEARRIGGAELAHHIREHRYSAVLDLSGADRDEQAYIAADFMEGLVSAPQATWETAALVAVDEAHTIAPERSSGAGDDRKASTGALVDLAARGRKRGLCLVAGTQRVAKLHKNVVAEMGNVLIGRTVIDVDVSRAAGLLGVSAAQAAKLRQLKAGDFFAVGTALASRPTLFRVGEVTSEHRSTPPLSGPSSLDAAEVTAMLRAMPPKNKPATMDEPANDAGAVAIAAE
ncbi:helicase HerA domain-containing protein [Azospirillum rugosum]|uniref:DNA helicase HerA-like ATPase n=1 Tax=Azospirillum rugosum TaxID=416170 RepID=A0ABS4SEK8_9PROT|nr:DUF87 domain-containing protein [Azospirillum rugosum]MBP2291017.1 DNA helicase HerA-like ATPase [Azospirillum rugosum]MDQ0524919.1 DNA helicase HerA-like ATPase [Azospirillum rugosum]